MRFYTKDDIAKAFREIIKEKHDAIFISGNLGALGPHAFKSKEELLNTILEVIWDISPDTTLMTSTFTLNLANTDIPYDPERTPSMHGAIANFFLNYKGRVRSYHPFTSFTAIGPLAEYLCTNNTRFSYGIDSPYDRLLSLENPLTISVGMPPNLTCSIIHHAEFVMHVPYRYIKEFNHPIVKPDGRIERENFYMHVIYHEIYHLIKRDRNRKFFKFFSEKHPINTAHLGIGKVYSYKTKDFFNSAIELLKKDIYAWLEEPPPIRPYRR